MAVVIHEMHVEVAEPQAAASSPAGSAAPDAKKDVSFAQAIEMYRERNKRLMAD